MDAFFIANTITEHGIQGSKFDIFVLRTGRNTNLKLY